MYNITAGNHTFYGVGEILGGDGTETADLFGALTVKYIPYTATAVDDVSALKNTFDIYPNPTKDVVHISFKNSIDLKNEIQLMDVQGHILKEYRNNGKEEMSIDLSSFPSNQYWIKVGDVVKSIMKL